MNKKQLVVTVENPFYTLFYMIFAICTGIIRYDRDGNLFWSIVCWIFAPLAWLKWLVFGEVNLSIIKHAFNFFFQ